MAFLCEHSQIFTDCPTCLELANLGNSGPSSQNERQLSSQSGGKLAAYTAANGSRGMIGAATMQLPTNALSANVDFCFSTTPRQLRSQGLIQWASICTSNDVRTVFGDTQDCQIVPYPYDTELILSDVTTIPPMGDLLHHMVVQRSSNSISAIRTHAADSASTIANYDTTEETRQRRPQDGDRGGRPIVHHHPGHDLCLDVDRKFCQLLWRA